MRGNGTDCRPTTPRPPHGHRRSPAPLARCPGDGCRGAGGRYSSLTEPPGCRGPDPPRPGRTPPCCPPAIRRWRLLPPSPTATVAGPAPCPPVRSTERRRTPPSRECRCPAGRAIQPRGLRAPNGHRCPSCPSLLLPHPSSLAALPAGGESFGGTCTSGLSKSFWLVEVLAYGLQLCNHSYLCLMLQREGTCSLRQPHV